MQNNPEQFPMICFTSTNISFILIIFINVAMQYLLMTFKSIAIAAVIIAAFAAYSSAASPSSTLHSYLSAYMPSSTINSAAFYNTTFNGNNYTIMQLSGNNYIVIENLNGAYSMLTSTLQIGYILGPFLTSKYYPSNSTLEMLNSTMESYKRYGYRNISDCLVETGLDANTCTLANECESCTTVPTCHTVLVDQGGPSSPFGMGIINFSIAYDKVNASFNGYFSLLSSMNSTNAGSVLSSMSSDLTNISNEYSTINDNPVFPPPQYFPSHCNPIVPVNKQPWYCIAVGFCSTVVQNTTAYNELHNKLTFLEASIPTPSGIGSISSNSSVTAQGYINAALESKNGAAYNSLINSVTPRINSLESNAIALLSKYSNASLNASLHTLENQFALVKNAGVNQTITMSNTVIQKLISNLSSSYTAANASYSSIYGTARNNTYSLLADQLSYMGIPTKLARLANEQQQINIKLNSGISSNDISAIVPELQTIRLESALFIAPFTAGYMIKLLDQPFINSMLGSNNMPVTQKIASAPVYASIESLIIDFLVILVILVITYFRIIKKGKLRNNKRAQRLWTAVFAVLIILALLDTYATYLYANAATNFLPFNYFLNTVKGSSNVYIALNGSAASNYSIGSCVQTMQSYLTKAQKSVQIIKLENYSCISGSNISVMGIGCYNNILASDSPTIYISQSGQNNITYKGLYGTVLYANGNVTNGKYCQLGTLFGNV